MCQGGEVRFVVYGAGAIGGLVGARLFDVGEDVLLIARGADGDAIARDGLTVQSAEGRQVLRVPVVSEPSPGLLGPSDVVLLGMKSQDTPDALAVLRDVATPSTPVVCLQNGVENERAALRLFQRVYAVCVMCPADHLEPGVVRAFSSPVPGLLDVGRYPQGTDEMSSCISVEFKAAGFDSLERPDIMRWKYCKLLLNLGNAVEALIRPEGRSQINQMARRGSGLLQGCRDRLRLRRRGCRQAGWDHAAPSGRWGSGEGGGSSWQSLQRATGRIESDYLNGEVVLLGREHGIATPVNQLLQSLAHEAARTARLLGP